MNVGRLLRPRVEGAQRVTNTEVFFDLAYVFAVTQLAKLLLVNLNWHGALLTTVLLFAVWWAWVDTAWVTNWLHPDARAVRGVLLGVMLASLVMSATLPGAFGARGAVFAVTYVLLQVGRTVFVLGAVRLAPGLRRGFQRILAWMLVSSVFWLAGGFTSGTTRDVLWLAAVVIDYISPLAGFYTPGLGRSTTADWTIAGDHLAERCQLFMIIAFGESILDTGAQFGSLTFTVATVLAFALAFVGTVALWWLYFDRAAADSARVIGNSADPGRLGRSALTYLHLPMVAGIIVVAVADQRLIAHPTGHTSTAVAAVLLAGPALFLLGHLLFKRAVFGRWSWPRLVGMLALAALWPLALVLPPVALAGAVAVVLVGVAVADHRSHRG